MINVSDEFKRLAKENSDYRSYADITLANGLQLHLTPDDFMVGGCTITDATTAGSAFEVGAVVGKTATVRLANHNDKFSGYNFYGATVWLYIALDLPDGTTEKVRKGKYYVIEPESPGDTISISMVDDMYKLDKPYASNTVYPATAQQVLADCCLDCGIPVGFNQLPAYTKISNRPEDVTYRNIVSYVCQIIGYNARIDVNGYMQLIWYDFEDANTEDFLYGGVFDGGTPVYLTGDSADGGNFKDYSSGDTYDGGSFLDSNIVLKSNKSVTVSTDDVVITGIRVVNEDAEYLHGTDDYVITLKDNPFTVGKQKVVADYLAGRMLNMRFRPFTVQTLCNPLYEPGDTCRVVDRKGNIYQSLINHIQFKVSSYTTLSCRAGNPVSNVSTYFSPAANAVVKARKIIENAVSEYDKAVKSMDSLAINALGYYETFEDLPDGSRISYLHDRPELNNSRIVYKKSIDGFFLSQDGGKTYTAGFDSQGNAVLNILYAVGIVADWIKGGTLTLGGMNNAGGQMNVLDADGNVDIIVNNDGITFYYDYTEGSNTVHRGFQLTKGHITGNGYITASDITATRYLTATDRLRVGSASVQSYNYFRASELSVGASTSSKTVIDQSSINFDTLNYFKRYELCVGLSSSNKAVLTYSSLTLDSYTAFKGGELSVGTGSSSQSTLNGSGLSINTNNYIKSTGSALSSLTISGTLQVNSKVTLNGTSADLAVGGAATISGAFNARNSCVLGSSTSHSLGFFGSSGTSKRSVSAITSTSSATAATNATKINEIITALKAYNLI